VKGIFSGGEEATVEEVDVVSCYYQAEEKMRVRRYEK
jgi:hypothetical protein